MTKHECQKEGFRAQARHSSIRPYFVIRHSCFVIQLRLRSHQTFPAKNGLCTFSSPTVVIGPCPGQMMVSSGNVRIFSRLFRNASWYETFPPPINPAKSEPPTIAIGQVRPVPTYVFPPWEWTQVNRVSIRRSPVRNRLPTC